MARATTPRRRPRTGASSTPSRAPACSVVIPIFNEEETLPVLYQRLKATLSGMTTDHEILFVNDGSSDRSTEMLTELARADRRVVVVHFARNFGHQIAISAGLEQCRGRSVVVMDGDLQDPPEVLPDLYSRLRDGYEVVYAVREKRKENILLRAAYAIFYRMMKRFASIDVPLDAGDFCIMDRRVVDLLVAMPERNRFVRGIRSWIGFRQVGLPYERSARFAGRPKYTLRRLVLLALDGLISFSHVPLRFITVLGLAVSGLSVVLAIFYAVKKLFFSMDPPGFTTLVVAILLLSGLQLVTLGVIGEYVGRIADEVKGRPLYVVRSIIRNGRDES